MILAIDTSQNALTLGLGTTEGKLVASYFATASADERGIHDERLAIETAKLLKQARITPSDVTRIILVIGPGSFTGLRIGLAFAKGFVMGTDAELVTVTGHELLWKEAKALDLLEESTILAIPGYRSNLVYAAPASNRNDIRLEEVGQIQGKSIIGLPSLQGVFNASLRPVAIPVERILLTGIGKKGLSQDEISTLEPLYITDFIPSGQTH